MALKLHRWLILICLSGYFVSRIFISFRRLQDRDIGTMFTRINANKVEVGISLPENFLFNTLWHYVNVQIAIIEIKL